MKTSAWLSLIATLVVLVCSTIANAQHIGQTPTNFYVQQPGDEPDKLRNLFQLRNFSDPGVLIFVNTAGEEWLEHRSELNELVGDLARVVVVEEYKARGVKGGVVVFVDDESIRSEEGESKNEAAELQSERADTQRLKVLQSVKAELRAEANSTIPFAICTKPASVAAKYKNLKKGSITVVMWSGGLIREVDHLPKKEKAETERTLKRIRYKFRRLLI